MEKQCEWKGVLYVFHAHTRRKRKQEGERGKKREREREREAEGLVKYRSEWQVRDKSSGSGTGLRSAAMVSKGKCGFLARRINTPTQRCRVCFFFSFTYVGPPSREVPSGSACQSHDRTRPVVPTNHVSTSLSG